MAINRGPWNALVDDDGSNLVGSVWNKAAIKDVILDPTDVALAGAVVDVPFNAASFGVYPAGAWTVTAGNVIAFAYTVNGKSAILTLQVLNSVITGTPLLLTIVCPVTAPRRTVTTTRVALAAGTLEIGNAYLETADNRFYLQRSAGNWPAGAVAEVSMTIPLFLG